ncbi:MAG: LacI family transcriptional regulator [Mycobacteriales bacterium]
MSPRPRATVALVAERANVSVASVSRVLNGQPASPELAARVRQAASELGYVPDASARSLKVRRTEQLALAVADVGNPVYVSMMRAVETVVKAANYRLLLSSVGSDPDDEVALLASLAHGYADGLILSPLRVTPALLDGLAAALVPVVVVGTLPRGVPVDNVRVNSGRGVGLVVRHLAETGRRSIGLLNGPVDTVPGAARQRGFERAMRELGLPSSPALRVAAADFTFAAGREAAGRLLDGAKLDGLVCANDLLAVGAVNVLTERGLAVPDDVAVSGMDGTELAELYAPPLTTVDLGATDRGRIAAELLLDRLRRPDVEPRRVTVAPRLIVRASTAPVGRSGSTAQRGRNARTPR